MKKILLLFLFVFAINLTAQDIYKIYKPYFPMKILESDALTTAAENNIQSAINNHPNLIYSYFAYLEVLSTNKDSVTVNKFLNHYNELVRYYHKQKWEWFNGLLKYADKISNILETKKAFIDYLTAERDKIPVDFSNSYSQLAIDTNKINHCALILFNSRSNIIYNPNVDYGIERNVEEENIINDIKDHISHPTVWQDETDSKELRKNIKYYWYLIAKLPLEQQLNILKGSSENNFNVLPFISYYIGGGATTSSIYNFNYNEISPIGAPYEFSADINRTGVEFFIGCKFRLLPNRGLFSYVKLEGGIIFEGGSNNYKPYSYYKSTIETLDTDAKHQTVLEIYDINKSLTLNNEINFYFSFGAPIFFIGKKFTAELDGALYMVSYKYSINASYNYVKTISETYPGLYQYHMVSMINQNQNVIQGSSKFDIKFVPLITLSYLISDSIELSFSGLYNNASIRLIYIL